MKLNTNHTSANSRTHKEHPALSNFTAPGVFICCDLSVILHAGSESRILVNKDMPASPILQLNTLLGIFFQLFYSISCSNKLSSEQSINKLCKPFEIYWYALMNDQSSEIQHTVADLVQALLTINRLNVRKILISYPPTGQDHMELVETLVVPALEEIGEGWESGQFSLTQVYMAGRLCEEVVEELLPQKDDFHHTLPPIAITTLEDYHTLGNRIVYSTLRASGIDLKNYGRMSMDDLVGAIIQDQTRILLISVLMLPSAIRVKELRSRLEQTGHKVKIIVGGAPFRFDRNLWQEVGADAYGTKASDVIEIVSNLIKEVN